SCLKRIRAAQLAGQVDGIIFFQGEGDTVEPSEAPQLPLAVDTYARMFETFITDMRTDIGSPKLPIVFAQIGSNKNDQKYINWAIIQQQQADVRLSCTAMIQTSDLELRDEVHFTTDSYRVIGERFADAFHNLITDSTCH
ncbi:MAG: sialate O-acetylesterase, partial [Anaerolineaceae bacterium]